LLIQAYDPSTNPLNTVEWLFAGMECAHISSLALSIGTIAMVDMSLLGVGLKGRTPAQLLRATELWTAAGLVIVITAGLALFSSDPLRYYYSPTFRFKMWLLLAGIVFNYTLHRKATQSGASPIVAKLAGATSLIIWVGVIFCGLFFAFSAGGY
jgi:hypothetical protein